ncbi:MAG TPA: sigma-70 family RNA polymerase sigma factor [Gaiellaceae bacterium]|nr:sigma-70 family RNA polymerase sigma factor [Gaiellaceae bacterium]
MSVDDERELVLRAQRGDARAFEELVRAHWEVAFRVAVLTTRDAAEAEDAAQEAVVKAWRALRRFDADRPLRPWLLRIVANEARNRRRAVGRRTRLASLAQGATPSGDAAPSPESTVVARDEHRRLLAALDRLPDDARNVLACRYLLDLSEEETAAALRVRRGTVKSRTARALDRLREIHDPA